SVDREAIVTRLGAFELVRPVREGGMGTVYLGRDTVTDRPVALKVLRDPAGDDAERFLREANVLATLSHPAIVRYVGHGRGRGGEPYLAMEWLDGEDRGQRLRRDGLSVAQSLALGARIADALGEAHARGVVHRDIKPANIFLPRGDPADAKLLDFGVAQTT